MSNSEDTNTIAENKFIAKFIINNVAPLLKRESITIEELKVTPVRLIELLRMIERGN
jgi:Asp-tRNA(Asn)/Glu-tRNA(Gln) amidotransferase B subunit